MLHLVGNISRGWYGRLFEPSSILLVDYGTSSIFSFLSGGIVNQSRKMHSKLTQMLFTNDLFMALFKYFDLVFIFQ